MDRPLARRHRPDNLSSAEALTDAAGVRPSRPALDDAFDPEAFRRDGHRVVDRLADYLARCARREGNTVLPWWEPGDLVARTPELGDEPAEDLTSFLDELIARTLRLHDPRAMGHQDGVPLPTAALGGFISSVLNNDPSVYETGPGVLAMEQRLLEWMCRELGYGPGAGGVFTSGGSLGNLTALLAARQAKAGVDAWTLGEAATGPLCVLVSEQAHYCVARSVQMMGWGAEGCVKVPVDSDYRLRPDALANACAAAQRSGRRPIAVVASACTTATSSFDPLHDIADFCAERDLWMHVDGAHGASAVLSPSYRHLVDGIERADSVVWDGHKMMMMPSLLTGVLFRDARRSYETFRQEATYLFEERPDEEWYNPGNRTVECTKPAMATRLYLALRVHGIGVLREYVTRTFDLARRFADALRAADDFELAVEPGANIVCFRFVASDTGDPDALQAALRQRLIRNGAYYLTQAELRNALWLRVSLMNPGTTLADLIGLLDEVRAAAPLCAADLGRALGEAG